MERLLVSACLLGVNCKYSGGNNGLSAECIERLREKYELVSVCPESDGGLSTPREPSERQGSRVVNRIGQDVTEEFNMGAQLALGCARARGCRIALLKANSPSCGSGTVYDGSFSGKLTAGDGVTAELLKKTGITIFSENELERLI